MLSIIGTETSIPLALFSQDVFERRILDGCAQKQCQTKEGSSANEERPKETEPEEVMQETNALPLIHVSVMENDNSTT